MLRRPILFSLLEHAVPLAVVVAFTALSFECTGRSGSQHEHGDVLAPLTSSGHLHDSDSKPNHSHKDSQNNCCTCPDITVQATHVDVLAPQQGPGLFLIAAVVESESAFEVAQIRLYDHGPPEFGLPAFLSTASLASRAPPVLA